MQNSQEVFKSYMEGVYGWVGTRGRTAMEKGYTEFPPYKK